MAQNKNELYTALPKVKKNVPDDRKANLMVTVSGGRSSAMVARHIQTSPKYKDFNKIYVFANTGQERVETIDFLKNMVKYWQLELNIVEGVYSDIMGVGIKYKLVDFDNLSMNSEPFEGAIMHKNKGFFEGVPNQEAPYCSESMKTIPCKKFCDDIFGVNNYIKSIGFRKEDMPKRITFAEIKEDKNRIFPLLTDFENVIGNIELNRWWNKQPFKLQIHGDLGNCELCWKKSDKTLLKNIRHGTRSIKWWQKMEEKYGNTAFRSRKSINDLVKMAQLPYTHEFNFPEQEEDSCVCNF
jgi:3'-phosphoadenosine 5'-phosphosulfate sulfotransferase (PAPS reductase)/FAD synthetase